MNDFALAKKFTNLVIITKFVISMHRTKAELDICVIYCTECAVELGDK